VIRDALLHQPTSRKMTVRKGDQVPDFNIYWNWAGHYVGLRVSDGLFYSDGRQLGFFAEGDEVYRCDGNYLGEVRGRNRLITNLSKKAWTRRGVVPSSLKSSQAHPELNAKEMLLGYEDFPAPSSRGE